ncbi:hypothetical protein CQW23_05376 [Capsicum baccatum]|uniref:Nucleoporin autopeptidase n=1 Tax=Capsicum baccatum TaxID=33114 RepID=A0A2G2XHC9_CAPBA|nr:hypothetical protein CQW23_05376 [Capsicum baccatum]
MSLFSAPSSSPFSSVILFGSTSGVQQTSNSGVPQLFGTMTSSAPQPARPFGSLTPFGANNANVSDSSVFGTLKAPAFVFSSNSHFGTQSSDSNSFGQPAVSMSGSKGKESTTPFLKSSGFGMSAFCINQKGSRIASYIATPEIGADTGPSRAKIQSICGMPTYKDKSQEELRFEDYQLGDKGTLAFNAATSAATSGQTENISPGSFTLPTFGKKNDVNSAANEPLLWSRDANVSDSFVFGGLKAPVFGVSSKSHFGTPRSDSYSFGQPALSMSGSKGKESTIPLFQSSGFGKPSFGINQKGSRTASYIATPEKDSARPGGEKILSICAMQTYKDKSHEELRFEDYQLGDKGQKWGFSVGISSTQGFGVIDNTGPLTSPVFNQSPVDQPFYSHFSFSNKNSTATASTPFLKPQQSISHIFPPKTSLLNTCDTESRVASSSSDVSFSPWIHLPFPPLNPASSSSTSSTSSALRNPWALSTSSTTSLTAAPSTTSTFSPLTNPWPFPPLNPTSSSSTFSTSSALRNPWALSTSSTTSLTQSPPRAGLVAPSTTSTFSPLTNPWPFPPLNPASSSSTTSLTQSPLCADLVTPSTTSTFSPLPNPWPFAPLKPSGHDSDQKSSFSPIPVLATGSAPQSSLCLNCLKQLQPTPPGLCNVSSSLSIGLENSRTSSPIMPPAETQPSVQITVEHPNLTTSIQYGISSLPVSNNPAPVRRKSSLIIRHSSLGQHRLPPQKYNPASDKPKVPFFMDKENASGLLRTEVIISPRENLRDWVRPTAKEFPLGDDSRILSQLKHISIDSTHGGKVDDKPKLDPKEMHYDKCGDDKDVDAIMPKLQRADYYTVPPIEDLISKEKEEADFCCHVKDFVVGRHGYGSIKFLGETDVRKLDLDSAVHFNSREVIVYMDESKKPPVGQGLNKPAEITLLNVRCINKSTGREYKDGPVVNKYRDMLIKKAAEQDAEFVSYDPVQGQWKFRVSHF